MPRITAQELMQLRNSPGGAKLFQYLNDVREELKDAWAEGNGGGQMMSEHQAKAQVIGDLLVIKAVDINDFYQNRGQDDAGEPEEAG